MTLYNISEERQKEIIDSLFDLELEDISITGVLKHIGRVYEKTNEMIFAAYFFGFINNKQQDQRIKKLILNSAKEIK